MEETQTPTILCTGTEDSTITSDPNVASESNIPTPTEAMEVDSHIDTDVSQTCEADIDMALETNKTAEHQENQPDTEHAGKEIEFEPSCDAKEPEHTSNEIEETENINTSEQEEKTTTSQGEEKASTDAPSDVSKEIIETNDTLGLESAESSKNEDNITKDIFENKDCQSDNVDREEKLESGLEEEKVIQETVKEKDQTESVEDVQKYIDDTSNEDLNKDIDMNKDHLSNNEDSEKPDADSITKSEATNIESNPTDNLKKPHQEATNNEDVNEDIDTNKDHLSNNEDSENLDADSITKSEATNIESNPIDNLKKPHQETTNNEDVNEHIDMNKDHLSNNEDSEKFILDNETEKLPLEKKEDPSTTEEKHSIEKMEVENEQIDCKVEDHKVENTEESSVVVSAYPNKVNSILDSKKPENPSISKLQTICDATKKQESPKRKYVKRNTGVPVLPNLHYLDSETNFGGFYPEYFDSTIFMYRGYWSYIQEEFDIPCRPLPAYKTTFYLNYTPSTQPVVQTSSGRVVKRKELSPPSAPITQHVSVKKETPPVKKESSEERTKRKYRLPLERYGWKREVVFRSSVNNPVPSADVYYYSPAGKKLRSICEIMDALPKDDDLQPFNFTFVKELLGFEEPLEVSRDAVARTLASCDDTPKRVKTPSVNRKVFFDKNSSNVLSSASKPKSETNKVVSMNGKMKKPSLSSTAGGVKRKHDELEDKPISPQKTSPSGNRVKATNGDVPKAKTSEDTKPVSDLASAKSSGDVKKRKSATSSSKPSGEHRKPVPQQSENKVPNSLGGAGTKHKPTESLSKSPSNKKRKVEAPAEPQPSVKLVARVIHNNKNILNDLSNQFNAIVHLCRYLRVEDLLRVARVNRLFNAAAHCQQLWQVVKLKNSKVRDWTGLADCLTRHGTHTLDMLKMIGSADPDENDEIWNRFYKVIGKIHPLRRLELGRVTAAEILNAASNCSKNLTEFSVIAQKLATIDLKLFQGLPNLELLQLRSFESKREHGLIMMNIPLLCHMSHLRHLSLTGVKNLKSYQVTLLKDFPPLLSLELGDCTKLDERFPECSLAHMTSLERLRLEMVQGNTANKFVETIATLPRLRTLELINIDTKKGFDDMFGRLSRVEHLLIFPTYITQSSTTNWLVLSGLARLRSSLKFLTWGLTQELLRVTTLFIEQWNAQLNLDEGVTRLDPEELKKTIVESNSIPVMKPLPHLFEAVHTAGKGAGSTKQNISELDILPIDELKAMLEKVLYDTKIKLITVPVSSTTRIYLPSN